MPIYYKKEKDTDNGAMIFVKRARSVKGPPILDEAGIPDSRTFLLPKLNTHNNIFACRAQIMYELELDVDEDYIPDHRFYEWFDAIEKASNELKAAELEESKLEQSSNPEASRGIKEKIKNAQSKIEKAYARLNEEFESTPFIVIELLKKLERLFLIKPKTRDELIQEKEAFKDLILACAPFTGRSYDENTNTLSGPRPINRIHYFMRVFGTEFQEEAIKSIDSLTPLIEKTQAPASLPSPGFFRRMFNTIVNWVAEWFVVKNIADDILEKYKKYKKEEPVKIVAPIKKAEAKEIEKSPKKKPTSKDLDQKGDHPRKIFGKDELEKEPNDQKEYLTYAKYAALFPEYPSPYLMKAALNDEETARFIFGKFFTVSENLTDIEILMLVRHHHFEVSEGGPFNQHVSQVYLAFKERFLDKKNTEIPDLKEIIQFLEEKPAENASGYQTYLNMAHQYRNYPPIAKHIQNQWLFLAYQHCGNKALQNKIFASSLMYRLPLEQDQKFFTVLKAPEFSNLQSKMDLYLHQFTGQNGNKCKDAFDFLKLPKDAELSTIKARIAEMRKALPKKEDHSFGGFHTSPRDKEILLNTVEKLLLNYLEDYKKVLSTQAESFLKP